MADVKITQLPAASGVTADDLVPIVNDPAGTPATQKATAAQVLAYVQGAIAIAQAQVTGLVAALAAKASQTDLTTEASTRAADDNTIAGALTAHTGLTTTAHGGIVASTDPRLTDTRTPTAHQASHQSGASDALAGLLDAVARLTVRKNTGVDVGSRRRLNLIEGANVTLTVADDAANEELGITIAASGGGGVSDGDKGDITVSGSGATWTIDPNVVTYAKMQDVSATSRALGRVSSGAGDVEELTGAQLLAITGAQVAIPEGRAVAGGTTYLSLPGIEPNGAVSTATITADTLFYFPIVVTTPITVDLITIDITGAAAAGKIARLGIYNAGLDWQPTALLLDAGTVAADSTGQKSIVISQALPAGRYLLVENSDGAPTLRAVRGGSRYIGYGASLGATPYIVSLSAAQALQAFAGTGVAWARNLSSSPFLQAIFLRVSVP